MKKWKHPGINSEYDGLYRSWMNMIHRAENKNGKSPTYSDVSVCDRWKSYDNFFEDMHETWFKGATIDKDSIKPGNRIYCKEYCKWITKSNNTKEMTDRLGSPRNRSSVKRMWSKKVKCIETGEIFESCSDATKKHNLKRGSVKDAANPNHKQKTAGGYHWQYI